MELDKAIKERKSIRSFSDKKPTWKTILECIDSARYSPMAGNTFSLRFILVDDREIIKKIAEAAQQDFISKAQYLVAVCTDPILTQNAYEERGTRYLRQQAGAAIQNFLLKIQESGLSTCWVGHFVDYLVREALKIPEGVDVEAVFPIAYESIEKGKSPRKKQKIELDTILYFNEWKNKKMKKKDSIDA